MIETKTFPNHHTVGKSPIDHSPGLRHNLGMLDKQHLQRLQVKGLRDRQNHLNFLLFYHNRMMNETQDPQVRELHYDQACELKETLAYVDGLIRSLEQAVPA